MSRSPEPSMSERSLVADVEGSQPSSDPATEAAKLDNEPAKSSSDAAVFNKRVFAKLQNALGRDPEVDLLSLFPFNYQQRLAARKITEYKEQTDFRRKESLITKETPFRLPEGEARIIYPLSGQVKTFLNIGSDVSQTLLESLTRVIKNGEVLFCTDNARSKYVVKCSEDIVVKSATLDNNFTEYTTLQYLQEHRSTIPAPRPHGFIVSGGYTYLFMSYIPGVTLDKVWPALSDLNKSAIQQNLNDIFLNLRQIPHPHGSPLGGVAGEGCKDTRRHTRISQAIYTSEEFWDFQYLIASASGKTYFDFLNRLTKPHRANEIVFSHGDVRDENIIVQDCDGRYIVSGLIDWEMSGFYPADFECTKLTNVLGWDENKDWVLYLPPCISPERYPIRWLADVVWDPHVA
ncbi:hypothetical protein TWF730_010130 [Orbilia blumenaviensis]|uniref:Aminoglycoside phosphotransferase domain-containing protein n=1 Tax=Orbilia blumenaviensis TaxID=1796055 RepID=A0AAV9UQV1_9PEZI